MGPSLVCIRCFQPAAYDRHERSGALDWFYAQHRGLCQHCEDDEARLPFQQTIDGRDHRTKTLQERFEVFHLGNPAVYQGLVQFTRQAVASGAAKLSIWDVANRLRWHVRVETKGDDRRINNDFLALYSRLLMAQEPDLAGIFDTRTIRRTA